MIEIEIRVCGDHWMNPGEVEQKLQQIPCGTWVMLNMRSEGASLAALGVRALVDKYLDPDMVYLRSWPNTVEQVPYHRAEFFRASHFFWMSDRYAHTTVSPATHERRFAAFVGRPTWPRVRMLWDLRSRLAEHCLFSLMDIDYIPQDDAFNLDPKHRWVPQDFDAKQSLAGITSIDGHRVSDQYDPSFNTNLSLLAHYHRFDIEIVGETYINGHTFFPTEKTIRPLLYSKPVLVQGPRHYLRNLREMGFKTWDQYWDESYDDLEGPERWQAMLQQIEILALCDHFDQLQEDYSHILSHNRDLVREINHKHRPG